VRKAAPTSPKIGQSNRVSATPPMPPDIDTPIEMAAEFSPSNTGAAVGALLIRRCCCRTSRP